MTNFEAESSPEIAPRPSEWDITEKFEFYRRAEEEKEGSGQHVLDEIKDYIEGNGDEEDKDQYYPGWTDEDFESLLTMVDREF